MIAARGAVSFAWFMEQALYARARGYYSSGRARIGRKGDYFTSVSVGPLFGRMLAAQFAEIRARLDSLSEFRIVEQGAGDGQFARDVLETLPDVRYTIVEPFAALRAEQTKTLAAFSNVEWRESLDALEPFSGVHFSNELIDAMPVHLVKWNGNEWLERCVAAPNESFIFVERPVSDQRLADRLRSIPLPLPVGYETEVNLAALDWIEKLAAKLTSGFVIAADYGFARDEFYAPHRTRGTLQSYRQHQPNESPLLRVGDADISAHVEWTSLAEQAIRCGFQIGGFTDQHHFLTGLLTDEVIADTSGTRALQTLLQPGFLGMKFQFLVLAKSVSDAHELRGLRFARDVKNALGLS